MSDSNNGNGIKTRLDHMEKDIADLKDFQVMANSLGCLYGQKTAEKVREITAMENQLVKKIDDLNEKIINLRFWILSGIIGMLVSVPSSILIFIKIWKEIK